MNISNHEITVETLQTMFASNELIDWLTKQEAADFYSLVELAMEQNNFGFVNWYIPRIMNLPQYVAYATFAAEQVIEIFEAEYPNDDRPRRAIKAARACIANLSTNTAGIVHDVHIATYDVASTVYDAYFAAYDVAAYAAYAAYACAYAADAAYASDASYAADAACAADAALVNDATVRAEFQSKIVNFGLQLLASNDQSSEGVCIQ